MRYWDRETLKTRAKNVLKNTYWMTFLAMLIISFLGGGADSSSSGGLGTAAVSIIGSIVSLATSAFTSLSNSLGSIGRGIGIASASISVVFFFYAFIALFVTAVTIFIGNAMKVGKCRFLTMCRYGEVDLGQLFFPFRNGQYINTIKIMFFKDLYVFLWSLLFIVPGIIKSYEYWMVPYILAENPNITKERAFEISSRATQGEKWEMFVLELSFIGWYLLGIVAGCGLGSLFVNPYYEATQAELYGALRYKVVVNGLCTRDEIGKELFS